jgi:hypothetical protein
MPEPTDSPHNKSTPEPTYSHHNTSTPNPTRIFGNTSTPHKDDDKGRSNSANNPDGNVFQIMFNHLIQLLTQSWASLAIHL